MIERIGQFFSRIPLALLSSGVVVAAFYLILIDPSPRIEFGRVADNWVRIGLYLFVAVAAGLYLLRIRAGASPSFQWPIKLLLASLAALATVALLYGLIYLAVGPAGSRSRVGMWTYMVLLWIAGLGLTAAFAGMWALLDRFFGVFAPRDVRCPWIIAWTVQLLTLPYVIHALNTPSGGTGAAAVGILFGAILLPPAVGLLTFLASLTVVRLFIYRTRYFG